MNSGREVQRDAAIERLAGGIEKRQIRRMTRLERLPDQTRDHTLHGVAAMLAEGHPHHADPAASGGGGNGSNRDGGDSGAHGTVL